MKEVLPRLRPYDRADRLRFRRVEVIIKSLRSKSSPGPDGKSEL